MKGNFKYAFQLLMSKEGGYSKAPNNDPGGETAFGVARNRWPEWEGWKIIDDLKITGLLSDETIFERCEGLLKKFYKDHFWNKLKCDSLPEGIDTFIFDCAVNQGAVVAARVLQWACGAAQDGIVGDVTLSMVKKVKPVVLLDKCLRRRLYYYMLVRNEENRKTNGMGWINRNLDVYTLCLDEV